jgi:hypothetical protein
MRPEATSSVYFKRSAIREEEIGLRIIAAVPPLDVKN